MSRAVSRDVYVFFLFSLGKRKLYDCGICVTDFRERPLFGFPAVP